MSSYIIEKATVRNYTPSTSPSLFDVATVAPDLK